MLKPIRKLLGMCEQDNTNTVKLIIKNKDTKTVEIYNIEEDLSKKITLIRNNSIHFKCLEPPYYTYNRILLELPTSIWYDGVLIYDS